MALTKETVIQQIEVVGEHKHVQVRTDTVVKEDGTELSRSVHRHVLHSGSISGDSNTFDLIYLRGRTESNDRAKRLFGYKVQIELQKYAVALP